MPTPLVDDLVEEVLLRLPPHEPASLVRAALVCRRWRRLVSDAGFCRRFREFHRSRPMLGILCNRADTRVARFVPTAAFCSPEADHKHWTTALDARHGRVLFRKGGVLVVWDPIMDKEQAICFPPPLWNLALWNVAVLCSDAAGACDLIDCHHRPFLVVFVGSQDRETLVYTYSSNTAAWGDPICAEQHGYQVDSLTGSVLVGNALYFRGRLGFKALKYNVESRQMSWIQLPSIPHHFVLTILEDGGLGIATTDDSNLYIWSRKDAREVDAIWERRVVVQLKTVFPVDVVLSRVFVIGCGDGVGILFMGVDDVVYTIDLKTCKVKKVHRWQGTTINSVFPYMSFYTPALGGTCTGDRLSASRSSA